MIRQIKSSNKSKSVSTQVGQGEFLGIPISSCTKSEFVDWVIDRAQEPSPSTAYAINASSVNIAFRNQEYWDALQNSDMVYCDGISVYWGCKILGNPIPEKLTTTDCLGPIAERCAARGLSMYIMGNGPGIAERAADRLMDDHERLEIKGVHSGFFDASEERRLISRIRRAKPQILWVGMGNPIQELWVEKHRQELEVPVIMTCGAMMEIVAGKLKRPPRWMTDNGFEWFYRLVNQPRRTWKRYLIGNAVFVSRLAWHACARRNSTTSRQTPIAD